VGKRAVRLGIQACQWQGPVPGWPVTLRLDSDNDSVRVATGGGPGGHSAGRGMQAAGRGGLGLGPCGRQRSRCWWPSGGCERGWAEHRCQTAHGSLNASGGLGSGGQHHSMFDWDVYDHDPHEAQDL
jgi:hypothetical protein